ncbi:MAG: phosphopantetheine-binding protein, partial [Myxococcota bacterium]
VLAAPVLDRDANFFTVGGNSLNATQIISRISDEFGVPIPLRVIFEHPTLRELARVVDEYVLRRQLSGAASVDRDPGRQDTDGADSVDSGDGEREEFEL